MKRKNNRTAFCIKHPGHNGQGSGASVVVASSESIARAMLLAYLHVKENGEKQLVSRGLLEVEPFDESFLAGRPVSMTESGVVLELWHPSLNRPEEEHTIYDAEAMNGKPANMDSLIPAGVIVTFEEVLRFSGPPPRGNETTAARSKSGARPIDDMTGEYAHEIGMSRLHQQLNGTK